MIVYEVKKTYRGCISLRNTLVDLALQNKESIKVIYGKANNIYTPKELENPYRISEPITSKFDGSYRLYDYKFTEMVTKSPIEERLGSWYNYLKKEFSKQYMIDISKRVAKDRSITVVYPNNDEIFNAFKYCDINNLKCVIVGQNPYHDGNADGIAFSCKNNLSPTLKEIYKTMDKTLFVGDYLQGSLSLKRLSEQGVLLLNTSLTVIQGNANSHLDIGWNLFIEEVLRVVKSLNKEIPVCLWGSYAKRLKPLVKNPLILLEAEHPMKAIYENKSWNCTHFESINEHLIDLGYEPIRW